MKRNDDYKRGIDVEQRVIEALALQAEAKGNRVEPSTKEENIQQDIDCWLCHTDERMAVSIKSQTACQKTGRIYLECEVKMAAYLGGDRLSEDSYDYEWQPSWWLQGKAHLYLIDIGERVLCTTKDSLQRAIDDPKVRTYHIQGNKPYTVRKQMLSGHPHHDARGICLYANELVQGGYAKVLDWSV